MTPPNFKAYEKTSTNLWLPPPKKKKAKTNPQGGQRGVGVFSGQIIATVHHRLITPMVVIVRESPSKSPKNSGLGIIVICPVFLFGPNCFLWFLASIFRCFGPRYRGSIQLNEFKAVMLAALRSLVSWLEKSLDENSNNHGSVEKMAIFERFLLEIHPWAHGRKGSFGS